MFGFRCFDLHVPTVLYFVYEKRNYPQGGTNENAHFACGGFEDPVIAEAIVDRLIHPSQKITLKGEKSYREKLAEKKSALKNQGGSV